MGKVLIKIKLTNLFDLGAQHRKLSQANPRSVEVEALVDTGATRLYLKPSVIRALGLEKVDEVISQTTNGQKNAPSMSRFDWKSNAVTETSTWRTSAKTCRTWWARFRWHTSTL